jgi:hypothetical protein
MTEHAKDMREEGVRSRRGSIEASRNRQAGVLKMAAAANRAAGGRWRRRSGFEGQQGRRKRRALKEKRATSRVRCSNDADGPLEHFSIGVDVRLRRALQLRHGR